MLKLLFALKLICFRLLLTVACKNFFAVCLIQAAALSAEPMLIYNLPTAYIFGLGPHMPTLSYKSIFTEISAKKTEKQMNRAAGQLEEGNCEP